MPQSTRSIVLLDSRQNILYTLAMSYAQAFRISWVMTRELFWWCALIALPLFTPLLLLRNSSILDVNDKRALEALVIAVWGLILLFFVLPQVIREAFSRSYNDFRYTALRSSDRRRRMNYVDSLQVTLLVLVIYAIPGLFLLFFARGAFNILHVAILVFFVFPAIAVIAPKIPFHGFRLAIITSQSPRAGFAPTSPNSL